MSSGGGTQLGPLVCPSCGTGYPPGERFCSGCKVPLVYAATGGEAEPAEPVSEAHARARKVKPQLAEGDLVKVVGARNQAEAEFIQGMLLEEGVPSMVRRSAGFDVPDFLAAGPRDILVPQSGVTAAREVLLQAELIPAQPQQFAVPPFKLLAWLLVALAVGALIAWLVVKLH